jgi:hypothetical protein
MKNLLTKVIILHQGVDLKTLATEFELPHYSEGHEAGRERLLGLAFLKINGLEQLILSNKFEAAKNLLLKAVGTRINFAKVFSKNPFTLFRTPYWKGSYVYALMDTFPQLKLNIYDFPKLPRYPEIIFDETFAQNHGLKSWGLDFVADQTAEYFQKNHQTNKSVLYVREQGVRLFTDRNTTGRVPKGPYINRAKLIKRATMQMEIRNQRP